VAAHGVPRLPRRAPALPAAAQLRLDVLEPAVGRVGVQAGRVAELVRGRAWSYEPEAEPRRLAAAPALMPVLVAAPVPASVPDAAAVGLTTEAYRPW
jgi:hypothetical protein